MNLNKIGFIGFGLIGGSIAKIIKKVYPDCSLIGLSGHNATIEMAYNDGVLDNRDNVSLEEIGRCDLIFLCTPVQMNLDYLSKLKNHIGSDTIITDVGSVKGDIHRMVSELGLDDHFIGGHPMAGTEKSGYANASEYLIENAYYIITPTEAIAPDITEDFKEFIKSLGAIPLVMECQKHDFSTAAISHLPHVIAAALVNLVNASDYPDEAMKTIAAGGFKDITRIASSSSEMWKSICLENREEILKLIDSFSSTLTEMKTYISDCDSDNIFEFFKKAKDYRDSFTVATPGKKIVYELFLDLIDEAGGIATVATILASNNISIKNIGIVHNREFEDGVLHIELYDHQALERSVALLRKYRYTVYER